MQEQTLLAANKSSNKTPEQTTFSTANEESNGYSEIPRRKHFSRLCHKHKSPLKLKRQLILTEEMGECSNFSICSDESRSLSLCFAFFPISYRLNGEGRVNEREEARKREKEFDGKVTTIQNESSLIKSSMLYKLRK